VSTSLNGHPDLAKHLERWVDEELISRSEAEAIARFEQRGEARPHRISLVTEAIGYVGAALLLAAGASLVSRFWDDMDELARITVLAIATVVLLVLGWAFRSSTEPAVGRLTGVLWVGAVGTAAGLAAVIAIDVANADGRIPNLAAGLAAMAVAIPLYLLRRRALQHIALFLGTTLAVGSAFLVEESPVAGYAVWAFAALWIVVTWFGLVPPERAGFALGSLALLISAQAVAGVSDVGLWLGLAASAALLAASVVRHERILLGFGVVGLFGFLMATIQTYLGGGAGTVAGLAIAGLVVIAVALVLSRRTARGQMGG
jgi:hypothetical protein